MSRAKRKCGFEHMRSATVQISLHFCTVLLEPLLPPTHRELTLKIYRLKMKALLESLSSLNMRCCAEYGDFRIQLLF